MDSEATGGKRSAWMVHVKKTMRANKGMKLGKVLKLAAKSYKKTKRGGGYSVYGQQASVGGRRRKSRRGGVDGEEAPVMTETTETPMTPAAEGGRRRRRGSRTRKH